MTDSSHHSRLTDDGFGPRVKSVKPSKSFSPSVADEAGIGLVCEAMDEGILTPYVPMTRDHRMARELLDRSYLRVEALVSKWLDRV